MKVGDLVRFFNPLLGGGFETTDGVVVFREAKMLKVMFNGYTLPRWVCHTQCEVISESH